MVPPGKKKRYSDSAVVKTTLIKQKRKNKGGGIIEVQEELNTKLALWTGSKYVPYAFVWNGHRLPVTRQHFVTLSIIPIPYFAHVI